MVLGIDIQPSELSEGVQNAYALYNHMRYLSLFESAAHCCGQQQRVR